MTQWTRMVSSSHVALLLGSVPAFKAPFQPSRWLLPAGEVLGFENLVFSIFEFVHTLLENNKFKSTVKKALPELIYYVILYMQITEDQVSCVDTFVWNLCLVDRYIDGSMRCKEKRFNPFCLFRSKFGLRTLNSLLRMRMMIHSPTLSGSLLRTCCW